MPISSIPIICVSYNSPELILDLLSSLRRFYANKVYVIDGSDHDKFEEVALICNNFDDVEFIHFDFNIHHGPGMAWAIENLKLEGRVLFLDSDIIVLNPGFIESMSDILKSDMYGVGMVNYVNEDGFNVEYYDGAVPYLHPACMLCNIEIVRNWPLPIKHGAPMIPAMLELHRNYSSNLIENIEWLENDFSANSNKFYLQHDWQGTVKRSGGYHLDDWIEEIKFSTKFDNLLISLIEKKQASIVQIECGDGAFVRKYKLVEPNCHFVGIDSNQKNIQMASNYCNQVIQFEPDEINADILTVFKDFDYWILIDTIEKSKNPVNLLSKINAAMHTSSKLIINIKNYQHWTNQFKLLSGELSHTLPTNGVNNFFTRKSILEMLDITGFKVIDGFQLNSSAAMSEATRSAIQTISIQAGVDPATAISDATATEYVFRVAKNLNKFNC